ncbi:MAG: HAD family phosphatase [Pirellulaceae bacterium]
MSATIRPMNKATPQKEYAGIIFDCDGTLTDSMPVHYLAWVETMNRYDIQFPIDLFYSLGGMPTNKIVAKLAREQSKEVDAEKAAVEKEEAFVRRIELLTPIEEVVDVAREFVSRIPICVASGGYRSVILQQLTQIGCGDLFDIVVTAEDTERHKPEPDVFLHAAKLMGTPPAQCLVYEDSDLGITAAKAAGMDWIDVRTFHTPRELSE